MVEKTWKTIQVCYCHRAGQMVGLEAEVIYPAEWLPDIPRLISHRCSQGLGCNLDERATCMWAGTNPAFDPFKETM